MTESISSRPRIALRFMALLGLLVGGFLCSPAAISQQVYQSTANSLYLRTTPGTFVIGTLNQGNSFRKSAYSPSVSNNGLWYFGYAGGNAHRCGWVLNQYLTPGGSSSVGSCSTGGLESNSDTTTNQINNRYWLLISYGYCMNDTVFAINGPGMFQPASTGDYTPMYAGSFLYRNYSPSAGFEDPYTNVGALGNGYLHTSFGDNVIWRYVYYDQQAILVKLGGGPWGFMPRSVFGSRLRYRDGLYRYDYDGRYGGPTSTTP